MKEMENIVEFERALLFLLCVADRGTGVNGGGRGRSLRGAAT